MKPFRRRFNRARCRPPAGHRSWFAVFSFDAVIGQYHRRRGGDAGQQQGGKRTPASSPLFRVHPLPVREIISLGGLADLRNERDLIKHSCDLDTAQLAGSPSRARPDVFADTDAAELMPNGSRTVLITGELDTVAPPRAAQAYAARARAAGDAASDVILPATSHYDEVAASSPSFRLVLPAIRKALQMGD